MASNTTKALGQLVVVILVIIVVIGWLFSHFAGAKLSATDAKKKVELQQLYTLLQFYYVGENVSPENPSATQWCQINRFYGQDRCLREVVRDGYADAIPQSPDNEVYYYHSDDEKFLVATRMSKELSKSRRCPYSDDPQMWCKVFAK